MGTTAKHVHARLRSVVEHHKRLDELHKREEVKPHVEPVKPVPEKGDK